MCSDDLPRLAGQLGPALSAVFLPRKAHITSRLSPTAAKRRGVLQDGVRPAAARGPHPRPQTPSTPARLTKAYSGSELAPGYSWVRQYEPILVAGSLRVSMTIYFGRSRATRSAASVVLAWSHNSRKMSASNQIGSAGTSPTPKVRELATATQLTFGHPEPTGGASATSRNGRPFLIDFA